jgi:hypothetical protein
MDGPVENCVISARVTTSRTVLPTHWTLLAIPDLDATFPNGINIMPQRDNRVAAA